MESTPSPKQETFRSIHGLILCLISAFVPELVLESGDLQFDFLTGFSRIAITFITLFSIHRIALISLRTYRPVLKNLFTLHAIIWGSLLLVWFGRILSHGLSSYAETVGVLPVLTPESFQYAIPYATGGLLVQAIFGLHFGIVFAISLGMILGVYFPEEPILVPCVIASTFIACMSFSRFRSRSAYLRAGLNIGIISIPFVLASIVIEQHLLLPDIGIRILSPLVGGMLCAAIAALVTPLFELLGGYVTDMRLIEMATLDHPLLKELSIQAPGTWNHSMVIGMMVESAADAVGANPVLARVGAYFHDIGKMKKPLYFTENQQGENRHDKLSTSMSALIIRAHVKDGLELAKEHRLPKAIQDMIPQHHGTSTIEFFYDKAKKEAEENNEDPEEVDRSLYSYPGPKPQTREAGILMLADGIEAAARTLSDPTLDRIQGLVQKMINKVFSSGQLNECELTLKDLHKIARCFTRVLNGIYHQRISYTEPAEKVHEQEKKNSEQPLPKTSNGTGQQKNTKRKENEQKKEEHSENGSGTQEKKEDLKRLGQEE